MVGVDNVDADVELEDNVAIRTMFVLVYVVPVFVSMVLLRVLGAFVPMFMFMFMSLLILGGRSGLAGARLYCSNPAPLALCEYELV